MSELFLEEKRLHLILSKLLGTSSNTLDVGCHVGSFLSAILKFAPKGRHVAIEASPFKANRLKAKFQTVRIEQVAISDQVGTAIFEDNIDYPGFSKLAGPASWKGRTIRYDVNTTTLDAMVFDYPVSFMKLDIEGAELAALRGGRAFLIRNRPNILFECGAGGGFDRATLYAFLTDTLGYEILTFTDFLFNKGPLSFDEFRKCGIYPFRAFNFIALPRSNIEV